MPSLLTPRRVLPLLLLAVILGGGSSWYAWVEGFGLFDGIYMAVITLTTVGYEEVQPLDESGRAFTIVYTIAGIGVLFYVASGIVEEVVAGSIAGALGTQRLSRRIGRMRDHVIVCGQSRVGREVVRHAARHRHARNRHRPWPKIGSTSRSRSAPSRSWATLPSRRSSNARKSSGRGPWSPPPIRNAVNTYIVLTARTVNPDIPIVARAASDEAVSPSERGGRKPRHLALPDRRPPHGRRRDRSGGTRLHRHARTCGRA